MRKTNPFSAVESRIAGLVHASARSEPNERTRHERLMVARLTAGALALAVIPPFLLWRGAPSPAEHLVLAAMAGPLLAAAILARTGWLVLAQAVVSVCLAAPIVGFAAASGGLSSAVALALLLLPAEAMLCGSRRAAIAAGAVALPSLVVIALLGDSGLEAIEAPPVWWLAPPLLVLAIGHGTVALLARSRRDARADSPPVEPSLLAVIDDLVTWHDRNGHVLEASPAATGLLGLTPASLRGRGLFSRVHVSDRPTFLRAVSEAAFSERPVVAEFRLHAGADRVTDEPREAPRILWVEMRAHRFGAAPDSAPSVVAVTRDVSHHKRREEAVEGARRDAERSDLSKGRLLAMVSHELRTPLNAMIGFSEILAQDAAGGLGTGKRLEYAGIIRDSGRHLLELANTLLDVSRIEAGDVSLSTEAFDAAALADGCCDLMSMTAQGAGIALHRDLAPDLPKLVADRRTCRQILINLISNALKFTPGGGEVRVGAARDRERIVLTVSDTGVGVAEADLPRLGDPFFQAGHSRGRSDKGAGLGLSVVRGLVALHGGSLAIESAPGKGTRVAVSLPIDGRSGAPNAVTPVTTLSRPRALKKVG